MSNFAEENQVVAKLCFEQSCQAGFWDDDVHDGEVIALIHSDLSAALNGLRQCNPPSERIPEFSAVEEHFADSLIRIMDLAYSRGWRIFDAVEAKIQHNAVRLRYFEKTCK